MHNRRNKEQEYLARKYKRYGIEKRWVCFGIWYDDDKGRYLRIDRYTSSSYWKHRVSKKVRKADLDAFPKKGNKYRRAFNYWNELY